jgi:hypothetical protein
MSNKAINKTNFSIFLFFQKIIFFKSLFNHRRLKISSFSKFNKFFFLGFRQNLFFLNTSLNLKTFFRIFQLFKFSRLVTTNFCFLCFDSIFQKYVAYFAKLYKSYCIYGSWFNGFFSRFLYQRALVLKKFPFFKINEYCTFFPDLVILIGNSVTSENAINEIQVLNIPIISISDLFFSSIKTHYFLLCDLKKIKQVYFYIRLFFLLLMRSNKLSI